ncbi:substrate-binding domain-containing protein [Chelativorans sp.]|uniref:substrate-binding domain-containing protein n=1 Tax=Chelativorans sp. TaxID=2203393 RepID=UPI0028111237|nr:substrate-binding domain-containing protein [Chelativorans sp.]
MGRIFSKALLAALFSAAIAGASFAQSPEEALAALAGKTLSTGPNGEKPVSASEISLTDDEITKIRQMNAKAAIVMHYGGDDWSQAQIAGLKAQFEKMGVEVIATTDAGFNSAKQVSDIETIMAQKPNIIVSIPTDPTATANAYRQAAEAGTTLVFMDNVPKGFTAGNEYVSVVSADNYGNGVASAHLMAKALNGEGQIGLVFHAADFFVTRQRYEAFKATIAENYPKIEIVAEQGIGGPDFAGDADRAASAMMVANPTLDGIWAVWDVPAEGVISAARANSRDNLVITTIDLGENAAIDMARGGFVKGLGAQRPYDQGVTEAILAGYGLIDKEAPAYVALPALPVEKANLLDAWKEVYSTEAPASIRDSMN